MSKFGYNLRIYLRSVLTLPWVTEMAEVRLPIKCRTDKVVVSLDLLQ